jgi:hypothetical protein
MNRYKFIDEGRKHCHTLDGKELVGGSTLKGIIGDKGGLYQYYADYAAVSGLSFPQQDISAEFQEVAKITDKKEKAIAKQKLDKKYPNFAEARRAAMRDRDEKAEKGTLRHGVLEDYIRNCIETFDGKPLVTTESAIFPFVMPRHSGGGGLTVYIHYAATSAITGTAGFDVTIERVGDGQQDVDSDGFATAQTVTAVTVPGTSGNIDIVNVAITAGATGTDSIAAGEYGRLRLRRDVANDTAVGDIEVYAIEVKET